MNGVQQEFEGQVAVVSLNVSEPANLKIQQRFGVRGHPTAVVLDADDQVTERFSGPVDVEALRAALKSVAP